MRLYESLVGNVGIGNKYIVQQWIDSHPQELGFYKAAKFDFLFSDSVGISQKEGADQVYFRPSSDIPSCVKFNRMRNMCISSGISNGPRPKYPEKYTPKHIGYLGVYGWDLRGLKLDFDCDGTLTPRYKIREFDKEVGVVEFGDNMWGNNTVINIKDGAFYISSIFHLNEGTVIHTNILILDTLNTTRYTSSKRVTEIVNSIVSSKNFPDLTAIYADNGVYTKSGDMWIFTRNK